MPDPSAHLKSIRIPLGATILTSEIEEGDIMEVRGRIFWAFGLALLAVIAGLSGYGQPQTEAVLKSYHVQITVEDQVAEVQIEQTYFNPTDRVLEEVYVFPVPKGTIISHLTLCSSKGCHEGRLLGAEEARRLYEEIVRRTKDPALLEHLGERAFRVRVFPIPPGGERTVKISYLQVLSRSDGLVELVYPLTSQKRIEELLIQVTIRDDEPIGNVYSPTHPISETRPSEGEVRVSFEGLKIESDKDFRLYYGPAREGIALDLLSFRRAEEDGYFLLLISWPTEDAAPLPKDIVFVLDISGSMAGEKIEQAKGALSYALGRLNPEDRFGLIAFSDALKELDSKLISASELDHERLRRFIEGLGAAGGTDIHAALLRALGLLKDEQRERPNVIVFITDGRPTAGVTDMRTILKEVEAANDFGARIFTFGVGYDVNSVLLDALSEEGGGFATYVEPGESLEQAVSRFYERVGNPIVWDLSVRFEGLGVYDLYPPRLPDAFAGDTLQLVGRYRAPGKGRLIIEGKGEGLRRPLSWEIELPAELTRHSFLPRIWAARAIGYLLKQIRKGGEDPELVARVKELAERFGIVTPYTSYFAALEEATGMDVRAFRSSSGRAAVHASKALEALAKANSTEELDPFVSGAVRRAGERTFVLREGVWEELLGRGSALLGRAERIRVKFGSEAYFALASHPELREYLKVGPNVTFTWRPKAGPPMVIEVSDSAAGITASSRLPEELQVPAADPNPEDSVPAAPTDRGGLIASAAVLLGVLIAALTWLLRR